MATAGLQRAPAVRIGSSTSPCARPRRCVAVPVFASVTNGTTRVTTIRKLVEYFGVVTIPGCYDSLSAKILQQSGHQVAYISGTAVSATQLGEPDLGLLMPPEMARRTSQICNSLPEGFPVIADADAGGGSILNVQRTIRSLMSAGAKGCVLDDKVWPRPVGTTHGASSDVIHREEYVAKILAAREVIGDADFFLIARTDARSSSAKHGLEDAITRANLYIDAGADAHLVGSVRSMDELRIVGEKTKGLRVASMVEGGVTPLCSASQLQELGFALCVFPLSSLYAAARALTEVYGGLAHTGSTQSHLERMVSWRGLNDILRLEDRLAEEEHFTAVKGPASDIRQRLTVKVKGIVKPVSVSQAN